MLPPLSPLARRLEYPAASRTSGRGLDWFTFFVANLQTGFGPFVAVYFTAQHWTQSDIGLVLTVGGLFGLLGQVPGGALVDAVRSKRMAAGIAVALIAASAAALAVWPIFPIVLLAMVVHSIASCALTPAVASISLGLAGHSRIGERLGRNASFSSVGNALAAAGMGACGYYLSHEAVFYVTAALVVPTLAALSFIRANEIDPDRARGVSAGSVDLSTGEGWRALASSRTLGALIVCIAVFYFANAAILPLVGGTLTLRASHTAPALIAACIVVPQIVTAFLSPTIGRAAQRWGRRPLLLIGFAALPIRALLFGLVNEPELIVLFQVFDGISAAVLGVMVPLIVADATRRTGRFNLALGVVGTAMGIGAALSTTFAGVMADRFGTQTAFLGLSALGAVAVLLVFVLMPESRRAKNGA